LSFNLKSEILCNAKIEIKCDSASQNFVNLHLQVNSLKNAISKKMDAAHIYDIGCRYILHCQLNFILTRMEDFNE
jgi:hypothetical protein